MHNYKYVCTEKNTSRNMVINAVWKEQQYIVTQKITQGNTEAELQRTQKKRYKVDYIVGGYMQHNMNKETLQRAIYH